MLFEGQCLSVNKLDNGGVELRFDRKDLPINKLDHKTLSEFKEAVALLNKDTAIKGLLITSAKKDFIVGADITEFIGWFGLPEDEFTARLLEVHKSFASMEDFPFPTVSAINGVALGGGFELPLSTDYRIMTTNGRVGLPEINLGIFPGWGGSFRLPRLIGLDNAFKWVATGKPQRPADALKEGGVDAVVEPEKLYDAGLTLLERCMAGDMDFEARRVEKRNGIKLNKMEQLMSFETARGMILGKAGPHQKLCLT